MDGAALPGATGGNPSLTIAAVAERCLQVAVRAITGNDSWQPPERADVVHGAVPEDVAVARVRAQGPMPPARRGIVFRETMRGAVAGTDVVLRLGVRIPDMNRFLADPVHAATLTGTVGLEGEAGGPSVVRDGILHLLAPSGLGTHATAGAHGARGPDRARSMEYLVPFTDGAGRECVLRGHKDVRRRSGTGPWRATTRLTATLEVDGEQVGPAGTLTITPLAALRLLASARATGLPRGGRLATAARAGATVLRFGGFFAKAVTSAFIPGRT